LNAANALEKAEIIAGQHRGNSTIEAFHHAWNEAIAKEI